MDSLRRGYNQLNEEIRRKTQNYLDIARDLRSSATDGGIRIQIDLKQLDRVQTELLRVQGEAVEEQYKGNDKNKQEFYAQRIQQLSKEIESLRNNIYQGSEKSVDLSELEEKLSQSRKLANDLATKIQQLDFEAKAPMQIQRLYPEALADQVGRPALSPKQLNAR